MSASETQENMHHTQSIIIIINTKAKTPVKDGYMTKRRNAKISLTKIGARDKRGFISQSGSPINIHKQFVPPRQWR